MPLYEYICPEDGEVIELLRSFSQADDPVPDPKGRGRRFIRKQSTFAAHGAPAAPSSSSLPMHSCGRCGKPGGGCAG